MKIKSPFLISLTGFLAAQIVRTWTATLEYKAAYYDPTVDPVDRIEQLLEFGAEDNLIVGTDYCHTDPSANAAALDEVQRWADEGRISDTIARKILETNANQFYSF